MSVVTNILVFLIGVFFDFYIFVLLARLVMQKLRAPWSNPCCQFVVKLTEPLIKPLHKILPGFKGFDLSIVFCVVLLELIENYLVFLLKYHLTLHISGALIVTLGVLLSKLLNLFTVSIVITAVLSWFPMARQNPLIEIVELFAEPGIRFVQRFVPAIAGLDFSPALLIIGLVVINMAVAGPLIEWGMRLSV